jgi:hypothetical protein
VGSIRTCGGAAADAAIFAVGALRGSPAFLGSPLGAPSVPGGSSRPVPVSTKPFSTGISDQYFIHVSHYYGNHERRCSPSTPASRSGGEAASSRRQNEH